MKAIVLNIPSSMRALQPGFEVTIDVHEVSSEICDWLFSMPLNGQFICVFQRRGSIDPSESFGYVMSMKSIPSPESFTMTVVQT